MTGEKSHGRDVGVTLIAVLKVAKALLLIVAGVMAVSMVNSDPPAKLMAWVSAAGIDPHNRYLYSVITKVSGVDNKKLEEVGVGSVVYAVVFLIEGIGLFLQKQWAEYLTIIVTASFIPFEIYELVKEPGAGKVATIVLNVAVLGYLVVKVLRARHHKPREALAV